MKKNEKGFALVLSLVLMLAMSLMGGALKSYLQVTTVAIIIVMNINKLFMLPSLHCLKVRDMLSINFWVLGIQVTIKKY